LTETVRFAGVVPLEAAMDNHDPADCAAAVNETGVVLETETDLGPGGSPPIWKANDSGSDATESRGGGGATLSVTGMDKGAFDALPEVIVIVPWYVAGANETASPEVIAERSRVTLKEDGVTLAPDGETESHAPPVAVAEDMLNGTAAALEETESVCDCAGSGIPF
jgi:hypothetical protein